jgi:hypothetical protein
MSAMDRIVLSLTGLLLAGCAGSDTGTGSTPPPSGPVLSGSPDSGPFVYSDDGSVEAGPLLSACDPSNANSCPPNFICYSQHTSASWWVDLYGTCTFDCNAQTYPLCDSLGGVCGCPVPEGAMSGSCALEGGVSMVCVPGLKPGTSPGANDGDGGCGTPGCSGGPPVEAGPAPQDAASE